MLTLKDLAATVALTAVMLVASLAASPAAATDLTTEGTCAWAAAYQKPEAIVTQALRSERDRGDEMSDRKEEDCRKDVVTPA